MSHNLTHLDGKAQFAYNAQRGDPWHRLGTRVTGDQTLAAMLEASGCDDTITLEPAYAMTSEGFVEIPGTRATVSSKYGPIKAVGTVYSVNGQQRRDLARLASEIVGRSGEACFDTMGAIGEHGEKFFAYLRFEDLVIDPNGIADIIKRGLIVATSYDMTWTNTFGATNVRAVCENTVRMGMGNLSQAIKVKHTADAAERVGQAAAAVGYAAAVEAQVQERAETMLRLDGEAALTRALDALWPEGETASAVSMNERATVRRLYEEGPLNAELVGPNGWAAHNAVTEFFGYFAPIRGAGSDAERQHKRTEAAVAWDSRTAAKMIRASEAILAGV